MTSLSLPLVLGVVAEFAVVVGILLAVLPGQRSPVDYLVIGTLATFIALATVFGVLMLTRKRPRAQAVQDGEASSADQLK